MQTIPEFFEQSVKQFADNVYMLEKTNSTYHGTTYAETRKLVEEFAAGLLSMGIQKGDRIALLSEGRNAWIISELGILFCGAINVPMSVKLTEYEEIRYRLAHSGSRMAIVSERQADKVRIARMDLPQLETLIVIGDKADPQLGEITFGEVLQKGITYLEANPQAINECLKNIQPTDPANICYTSGTTAAPKGIVLSHNNYVSNVLQSYTLMDIPPDYTTLAILPWDHAFAHTACIYCMMGKGASLASIQLGKTALETLKNIPVNIRENRPHLLMSVPALATNFRKNIEKSIREKGPVIHALFNHALNVSYKYNRTGFDKGKGLSFIYKPLVGLYDKILFSKIREGFGGRLEFFIGGGALLDIELQRFFYAIGMPMFQGYGLTEASPVISSNSKAKHKLGSSGVLVKNLELKICDDKGNTLPVGAKGEIVVRGENVMLGYWDNPEASAESLRDGWLYTGDLGYMDKDGFLYVLGRFKSLLIADDGEKYSPEGIEEAFIAQSDYIDQCMLYNNQSPYTICLLVPNKEALKRHLEHKHLGLDTPEATREALHILDKELQHYKGHGHYHKMFPQRWLPAATGILSEAFTEDNHMMNSTLKMVRGKITEAYKDRINLLYTAEGKDFYSKENMEAMKKMLTR
ncbi:MAG: AMP-binding protein [Bacteroidales bacterium]|nr:AMP-binding protein [Bacteroidales bacterium]